MIYSHILWYATRGAIPASVRIQCLKHCLTPSVHYTEYRKFLISRTNHTEYIILTISIRGKRCRERYRTTVPCSYPYGIFRLTIVSVGNRQYYRLTVHHQSPFRYTMTRLKEGFGGPVITIARIVVG